MEGDGMENERTLGILMEQGRWMAKEITLLRREVRELRDFKVKVIGFSTLGAFISTLLVEWVKKG